MESFYTIQGEGFYQGFAAWFIRLGGCDVGCVWCDVKESWDGTKHPQKSLQSIMDEIKATPAKIAVVTGGEPLMQDCGPRNLRCLSVNGKLGLDLCFAKKI
jgi:7-carboxy-7-deazaguanine synthase